MGTETITELNKIKYSAVQNTLSTTNAKIKEKRNTLTSNLTTQLSESGEVGHS